MLPTPTLRLASTAVAAGVLLGAGIAAGLRADAAPATSAMIAAPAATSVPGTIGLALTSWDFALFQTPEATECSLGINHEDLAQFKASPESLERINRYGGTFETRGPNGETGGLSPLAVEDPLPFSELVTTTGYGLNLDGTDDGRATDTTCKHEKFTSLDGQKVDNQLARVIGCIQGYRKGGGVSFYYSQEIANITINRHLIEITGVDDAVNDPAVEVALYKGMDRLVRTGDDGFVPFLSQRIDPRFPKYTFRTTGRIEDGVLITDPIPALVMPRSYIRHFDDRKMRDMVLKLKLTPEGAEGMLVGYEDVSNWYATHGKMLMAGPGKYSSPSIYKALHRYADGYPDPQTGQCTHISAAYDVTAVRALIIHPPATQLSANERGKRSSDE